MVHLGVKSPGGGGIVAALVLLLVGESVRPCGVFGEDWDLAEGQTSEKKTSNGDVRPSSVLPDNRFPRGPQRPHKAAQGMTLPNPDPTTTTQLVVLMVLLQVTVPRADVESNRTMSLLLYVLLVRFAFTRQHTSIDV